MESFDQNEAQIPRWRAVVILDDITSVSSRHLGICATNATDWTKISPYTTLGAL